MTASVKLLHTKSTCEVIGGVVKVDILVGSFNRVTSHWQSVPSVLAVTNSKADPRPDMLIEYTGCLDVIM